MDSLAVVGAGDAFPTPPLVVEGDPSELPVSLLPGESPLFHSPFLLITNYRLHVIQLSGPCINVPLRLIETADVRDVTVLHILCKDGRVYRYHMETTEDAQKWAKRIQEHTRPPTHIDDIFAFRFFSFTRQDNPHPQLTECVYTDRLLEIKAEAERLGLTSGQWRISTANENYELCPSYPQYLIVPSCISDNDLKESANYRYSKRIPVVVWRHPQSGGIIARSSQPKLGILGWREVADEKLLDAIAQGGPLDILDARSFGAAVGNRARGGGYEWGGYYPRARMHYAGLANIHAVRAAHAAMSALHQCSSSVYLSNLEASRWVQQVGSVLSVARRVARAVAGGNNVLVHCSDGWDRTPQITALAQIMLDSHYRTHAGFQSLVEREWLGFGHKFHERCGGGDWGERSPVFLQFLDCVYQLVSQFPHAFQFNTHFLARLSVHVYSGLFGTFLCDTERERVKLRLHLRTSPIWPTLHSNPYVHNNLYSPTEKVLYPMCHVRSLHFWQEVYLPQGRTEDGDINEAEDSPEKNCGESVTEVKVDEIDGLEWHIDLLQESARNLVLNYESKIAALQRELQRNPVASEDTPSSETSGEQTNSDGSWDLL